MDLNQTRELLPWFLNGTLEPGERANVAKALAEHSELREELAETWLAGQTFGQRIPTEEVVAYVFGEETSLDPMVIDKLADPSEVAMVRESLAALRHEAQQPSDGHTSDGRVVPFERPTAPPPARVRTNYFPAAIAAGLMSLVALTAWFVTWQGLRHDLVLAESQIEELQEARFGLEVGLDRAARRGFSSAAASPAGIAEPYILDNGVQRNGSSNRTISLPSDAEAVSFFLRAPTSAREVTSLQLRFEDSEGREVERIVDLDLPPNNEITVVVPADGFTSGSYRAELRSGENDAWRILESYSIEIVRGDSTADG